MQAECVRFLLQAGTALAQDDNVAGPIGGGKQTKRQAMMLRANFESSGYKSRKVKEFDHLSVSPANSVSAASGRMGKASRAASGLGASAAFLGAVCVVGVFAVLAALFAVG